MMEIRTLLSALALGALAVTASTGGRASEPPKSVDVAFANGMDTTLVEAVCHLSALVSDLYRETDEERNRLYGAHSILLYHVGSFAKNLQEVMLQKEQEASKAGTFSELSRAYFLLLANHPDYQDPYVLSIVSQVRDPAENLRDRTIKSMTPRATVDREVSDDAANLRSALIYDRDVLLVSHSQGNLYSNQAISLLVMDVAKKSASQTLNSSHLARLHVVGVAVPAAFLVLPNDANGVNESRSNYMTSSNDGVISSLFALTKNIAPFQGRGQFKEPLPANMTIPFLQAPSGASWLERFQGHGFETAYIAKGTASNTQFIDLVNCSFKTPRLYCAPSAATKPQALSFQPDPHFSNKGHDVLNDDPPIPRGHEVMDWPEAKIASVLEKYPDEATRKAALSFSHDLWNLWEKTQDMKAYEAGQIESLERSAVDSEVALLGTMRVNLPERSADQLLAQIQYTLAATPDIFYDYIHADRLVSGHPLDVEVIKYGPNFARNTP